MQTKKYDVSFFLVITLFVVSPFVMSFDDVNKAELISARMLPSFVSDISNVLRWLVLGLLLIITLFKIQQKEQKIRISVPVLFLSLFYLIQFFIALIDGVDYVRFLLMFIFSLLIPPIIGQVICKNKQIIKYFLYSIVFFLSLSLILNGHLVLIGQRFLGFVNNPNLYGIFTVFWMTLLLFANRYQLVNKSFFTILFIGIFLTMFFTGSRNALAGMFLIIFFNYYNQLGKIIKGSIVLLLIFIIIINFVNLSSLIDRFENIFNSLTDSGRMEIWERANYAINQNFWFGNGMDANWKIANTGNTHNCYYRFVLNMGMFFTVLSLFLYLLSIVTTYLKREKVPLIFVGYLITFALMNIGEDFYVGLGSTVFVYLLFIYGFINYFITNKDALDR